MAGKSVFSRKGAYRVTEESLKKYLDGFSRSNSNLGLDNLPPFVTLCSYLLSLSGGSSQGSYRVRICASLDVRDGRRDVDSLYLNQQVYGVVFYGNDQGITRLFINDGLVGPVREGSYLPVSILKRDGTTVSFDREKFYERIETTPEEMGMIRTPARIVEELERVYGEVIDEFRRDVSSYSSRKDALSREDVLFGILLAKEFLVGTRVEGLFSSFPTYGSRVFHLEKRAGVDLGALRGFLVSMARDRVVSKREFF